MKFLCRTLCSSKIFGASIQKKNLFGLVWEKHALAFVVEILFAASCDFLAEVW